MAPIQSVMFWGYLSTLRGGMMRIVPRPLKKSRCGNMASGSSWSEGARKSFCRLPWFAIRLAEDKRPRAESCLLAVFSPKNYQTKQGADLANTPEVINQLNLHEMTSRVRRRSSLRRGVRRRLLWMVNLADISSLRVWRIFLERLRFVRHSSRCHTAG